VDAVVSFRDVSREYRTAGGEVLRALRGATGDVPAGRAIAVTGRSGSGKSTLLHLAAGIDEPSGGEVILLGRSLGKLGDAERTRLRRDHVGLVFQFENGLSVYVAGDTNVFGDMQLIARLYQPDVAVLPIGGHYTMDPHEAALALELLGVQMCIPSHYGTFPPLKGTPDQLRELTDVDVVAPQPGETIALPAHVTA
jgi:ABC-type histidine transport system ATPase subunit